MKRTITSEILVSYSQCPRKAYLLLCTNQRGTPNEYMSILQQRREALQRDYIKELKQKNPDVQSYNLDNLRNRSGFLINATLKVEGLEAGCGILTKVDGISSLGRYSYEPTLFIGTHRIDEYQKLEMFFAGHVLEKIQSKPPAAGRIIGMDKKSHKVKLENGSKVLIPLLEPLQEWAEASSPEPPMLILNKHCDCCQFQSKCKAQAEQEDNLSYLNTISTPKAIRRYERKGIFTVKQLSYTFKPRRRKKRAKNPPTVVYRPELQALAIRTEKIYLQELPDLSRHPIELFVDIESIPDQQFYYLFGLTVYKEGTCIHHFFWADTPEDEAEVWRRFCEEINQYPGAPVYHYGSYEPRAITKLSGRYRNDGGHLKDRLTNVNNYIYGKVYFPVRSNHLKEIGRFIGASWTSSNASGLQAIVWRYRWDETRDPQYRNLLVSYNKEDCQALKLLVDKLSWIKQSADVLSEIDFADKSERPATEVAQQVHSQFDAMLKFASVAYDKRKISFRQDEKECVKEPKKKEVHNPKGNPRQRRSTTKATKIVHIPAEDRCPTCGYRKLQPTEKASKRLIVDLVRSKSGIRKRATQYIAIHSYCPKCHRSYVPAELRRYSNWQTFGHGFRAWIVYLRVALRLPYEGIVEMIEEQFGEEINPSTVSFFIKTLTRYYAETEEMIAQRLLEGPIVHADEKKINIKGFNWYVWVFTNEEYVLFKLRETREASIVHEFLDGYQGILVSDFYAGYDSVECRQQKCWVHLIRDINDDILENPFDSEFEVFVLELRDLIIPIMEAVQKYGLKKRNLNKFRKPVDRFYKNVIIDKQYKSDLVLKYQSRFIRYRESLFTFLEHDGVPWHNNTAERAIRHVAKQRDMSSPLSKTVTPAYLLLLSIRQTCRFQGKSFFKFLFSGERDIDKFK